MFVTQRDLVEDLPADWYQEILASSPDLLKGPIAHILSLSAKRIRPRLLLHAANLFGANERHSLIAAAAVELFHNFSLAHDDVMDEANLRRNKPSLNAQYGTATAILTGDGLLIYAYRSLSLLPAEMQSQILPLFNEAALRILAGQQEDMAFESKNQISLEEYLSMIEKKTAELLSLSLEIGGICGQASLRDRFFLRKLGIELGLAFQVMDDYLDSFGQPELTGKTIGGDIARNKKTFLTTFALTNADEKTKKRWTEIQKLHNGSKLREVLTFYRDRKADQAALHFVMEKGQQAEWALNRMNGSVELKQPLFQLIQKLRSRTS